MLMNIQLYEGYLRNRAPLCRELGLTPGPDRRETELRILGAGWRRWGREVVRRLYGSFTFAIQDGESLFCARDAFGIQTFYYCAAEDGAFLYGPDLRTVVKSPHYRKALDRDALQLYLLFGYPVGERTLYEGVFKLMPGCTLLWDGKSVRIERWYSLSFHPENTVPEEDWAQRIDGTLQEILDEDRSCFELTSGLSFLSGGVDSSYLLASSGVREAVGIGFENADFSEAPFASAAADKLGARFREVRISAEQYFESLPHFVRNLELPLSDPSAPAFAVGCEKLKGKRGPCFSGEGADEFFAGYRIYRRAGELGKEGAGYYGCDGLMEQEAAMKLLNTERAFPLETLIRETGAQTCDAEQLSRMLAVDISLWLEGDILFSVGRSARANGIDLLLPFADRRMFELSADIPSALKRKGGTEKYILRKAAQTRIPQEIAFRPKVGFSVPARQWFREERFRPWIEQLLFGAVSRSFFNQEVLRTIWQSFLNGDELVWRIPYAVIIFVLWYETCFAAE